MRIDCTYKFIETWDKSKFCFVPASYDAWHNTYIPPMVMPIKEQGKESEGTRNATNEANGQGKGGQDA